MSKKCSSPGCVAWAFEAGLCKAHVKPDKPAGVSFIPAQLKPAAAATVPPPVAGGGAAKSLAPHAPPSPPSLKDDLSELKQTDYGFLPEIGELPELNFDLNLPGLGGIVDDVVFDFAEHMAAMSAAGNYFLISGATADCLFISGATGIHAGAINGGYDRTGEMCIGYALYRKRCDPGIIMEHRGEDWEVKPVSSKGTGGCIAFVKGGCAAEACTSRMWKVADGATWQDAPSVKMVTGAEAQRQVERRCMRALQHPPPPPPPRVQLLPLTCCAFCAGCC